MTLQTCQDWHKTREQLPAPESYVWFIPNVHHVASKQPALLGWVQARELEGKTTVSFLTTTWLPDANECVEIRYRQQSVEYWTPVTQPALPSNLTQVNA